MSVGNKLITALSCTAVLAAIMTAANLFGSIAQVQWVLILAFALALAWTFVQALALTNGLRRIGAACREANAPAGGDDLADLEVLVTQKASRYRTFSATVAQGLDSLLTQIRGLSAMAERATAELATTGASPQAGGSGLPALAQDSGALANRLAGLNARIASVSEAAGESAEQVGIISGATEKMSSTITEIAIHAEKARTVAGTAVANVNAASSRVDELGAAALEINKVTDVIVEIAEQTKLLALNATIEAARAGEAGKGFAVVANEVKELALQTNNAIAEIRNKVEAMQQSTDNTIAEIGAINQTIRAVNEIVVAIAGAVEDQSTPGKEIVSQLGRGAAGIAAIKETVDALAAAMTDAAGEIARITTASRLVAETTNRDAELGIVLAPMISSLRQQIIDLQATGEALLAKARTGG